MIIFKEEMIRSNKSKKIEKDQLISIFEDTLKFCELKLDEENSSSIDYDSLKEGHITVSNVDCVFAARNYVQKGYNVSMLNMASFSSPGGGVKKGSRAQEEHLCRLSNLYPTLKKLKYPWKEFDCFAHKNVTFVRDEESFEFLKKPWKCDIISVAGYKLSSPKQFTKETFENMVKKIQQIVQMAVTLKTQVLVLSPIGCGAYSNPNDQIALAFWKVFVGQNWKSCFHRVVFAIIDDHNSSDIEVFKNMFANK